MVPELASPSRAFDTCNSRLPTYMVPLLVIPICTWPLNTSGKCDRKCLPRPSSVCNTPMPGTSHLQGFSASSAELEAMIMSQIQLVVGRRVDWKEPLMQAGLNSLASVRLSYLIQQEIGPATKEVPRVLVFQHPTASAIFDFLNATHSVDLPAPTLSGSVPSDMRQIAVNGVGCVAAASCSNPTTMYSLLCSGSESLSDLQPFYLEKTSKVRSNQHTYRGRFIQSPAGFDHTFFEIGSSEASATDPHHRILLEQAFSIVTHAGYSRDTLFNEGVGVYIGFGTTSWSSLDVEPSVFQAHGQSSAAASGRVSYVLGLTGPCISVNTACSSSLVAMHMACHDLRAGDCTGSICAGVSLSLGEHCWIAFDALHALAPDGRW